ncbi:MAG: RNA polymerase sigma factor (sigma-70 family) [Kiritimatiellia bacterium]|jgi:RNA polymerase sigma factor (sigma-70 family)
METTRHSLLLRLKDGEQDLAWEDFFRQYAGVILRYGHKMGMNDAQAQDVLQDTMIELIRILATFEYNPRRGKFRNFLLTIVHRKVLKQIRTRQRKGETPIHAASDEGIPYEEVLRATPNNEILERDEFRWRRSVFEDCLVRLALDPAVKEETLEIFKAFAMLGQSAREVAETFGTSENNVYQIKNRLMSRLEKEVEYLLHEDRHAE